MQSSTIIGMKMKTSISTQAFRALSIEPNWLWTWNGVCVGHRVGDSLFASDGLEVGRFSGFEIYAADGQYLGELTTCEEGPRLVTSVYKKGRAVPRFAPTLEGRHKPPAARPGQGMPYCGYEEFPSLQAESDAPRSSLSPTNGF
jgi:hypothetical protein